VLNAQAITIHIGARDLVARLDLALRPGECWALLGRNGAGKTSLILALAGLRTPAAGVVTLDGRPLSQYRRAGLARRVGVLLQDDTPDFWGSALEYALLGRYPHASAPYGRDEAGADKAREWLARLDLEDHVDQPYVTLSGGERQRVRIAQLLVQDPDVLLLDEPLNHLDLRHQVQAMDILAACARGGKAVLMALHEPNLAARYCGQAVLLYDAGRSSVGRSSDMLTQARLEALYQCRLQAGGAGLFIPT
jgi:iron complex transport system ATP-binding protein